MGDRAASGTLHGSESGEEFPLVRLWPGLRPEEVVLLGLAFWADAEVGPAWPVVPSEPGPYAHFTIMCSRGVLATLNGLFSGECRDLGVGAYCA